MLPVSRDDAGLAGLCPRTGGFAAMELTLLTLAAFYGRSGTLQPGPFGFCDATCAANPASAAEIRVLDG